MESAENQTELFEALLKWMASFRVAAGKMIREGLTKGTLSWLLPKFSTFFKSFPRIKYFVNDQDIAKICLHKSGEINDINMK